MDQICQVCPSVGPGLPEEENQRPRGFQVTWHLTSSSGDGGAIWTQLAAGKELVVCLEPHEHSRVHSRGYSAQSLVSSL